MDTATISLVISIIAFIISISIGLTLLKRRWQLELKSILRRAITVLSNGLSALLHCFRQMQ